MNYGDIKVQFTGLANRRDLTTALTTSFLQQSILRIQRDLRVPAMEKSITATVGNLYTSGLDVPGDLLQLQAITDETDPNNVVELHRAALPDVLDRLNIRATGPARVFSRRASKFVIAPKPLLGSVLRMDYYATFRTLSADADTNVLADIAPDLIIYGGLAYAAAYFLDKREGAFEARFQQILQALQDQALRDELTGNAQVQPASNFPSDW